MEDEYRTVKVMLLDARGQSRAWNVEVDSTAKLESLIPDLVAELKLGSPKDYELYNEGSIAEPVLVLKEKERRRVRNSHETG